MRCSECDADLKNEARFCHACGSDVQSSRQRKRLGNRTEMADKGEIVLWTGSFSAKGLIHSWLLAMLLTIVMPMGGSYVQANRLEWNVILGILALIWMGLLLLLGFQKLNVRYELTDQRLIHKSGILVRRTNRIELIDMDDISHEQGLIERLFDVGTIEITSSDRSHPVMELPGISHVDRVAMLIDDARRRERMRRGIHIEQI